MKKHSSMRWIAWALVALVVASCSTPLPMRPLQASRAEVLEATTSPQARPSITGFDTANASASQRVATADAIWRTIADHYYDPGFNGHDLAQLRGKTLADVAPVHNDSEFYRVLKRDVKTLKDSHTSVLTPREAQDSRTKRATQMGLQFTVIDDRVVITRVVPGFPADRAGVKAGSIIASVDGLALDAAFLEAAAAHPVDSLDGEPVTTKPEDLRRARKLIAVRNLLVGPTVVTATHRLVMIAADDSRRAVDLIAQGGDLPTRVDFTITPERIGVLRFTRFDWDARDAIGRAIDAARDETVGLVIDLRSNPGGDVRLFEWLLGRFTDRPLVLGVALRRTGPEEYRVPLRSGRSVRPYTAPIAVLVDQGTASAAELTAHALVEQHNALAVGEATCGCVVAIRGEYVLPDGGALRVAVNGFRSARGRRMESDPLEPVIPVAPTLADRRADRDVALAAAEKALLNTLPNSVPTTAAR